jgi:hypothetical protein
MLTHTVASVCHLPPPCSACLMINANQELEMGFRNNIRWIPKGSRQFEFCWGFGQAWSMMRSEGTAGWDLMRSCTSLRKARCSIVRETGVWELDWNWTLCVCVCVWEREREREKVFLCKFWYSGGFHSWTMIKCSRLLLRNLMCSHGISHTKLATYLQHLHLFVLFSIILRMWMCLESGLWTHWPILFPESSSRVHTCLSSLLWFW